MLGSSRWRCSQVILSAIVRACATISWSPWPTTSSVKILFNRDASNSSRHLPERAKHRLVCASYLYIFKILVLYKYVYIVKKKMFFGINVLFFMVKYIDNTILKTVESCFLLLETYSKAYFLFSCCKIVKQLLRMVSAILNYQVIILHTLYTL